MNNIILSSLKFVFVDVIGDFLYWPIWWYTVGLKDRLIWFGGQLKDSWNTLAIGLWLKNFFVPMYADRSILGRGISLVMRIIILIWKMVWFLIWTVLVLAVLILWVAAPVGVAYMIVNHINI